MEQALYHKILMEVHTANGRPNYKIKKNETNTTAPTTSDIVVELAISAVDGKIYLRKTNDDIVAQATEDDAIALSIALG